eukprot:jgi/Tetstr1/443411/TSEL_031424.t2
MLQKIKHFGAWAELSSVVLDFINPTALPYAASWQLCDWLTPWGGPQAPGCPPMGGMMANATPQWSALRSAATAGADGVCSARSIMYDVPGPGSWSSASGRRRMRLVRRVGSGTSTTGSVAARMPGQAGATGVGCLTTRGKRTMPESRGSRPALPRMAGAAGGLGSREGASRQGRRRVTAANIGLEEVKTTRFSGVNTIIQRSEPDMRAAVRESGRPPAGGEREGFDRSSTLNGEEGNEEEQGAAVLRSPTVFYKKEIRKMYQTKDKHVVRGAHDSGKLNKLSGSYAFGATVVRPAHVKDYYKRMQGSKVGDEVDFGIMLRVIYPNASKADIEAMRAMAAGADLPSRRALLDQLEQARMMFKAWTGTTGGSRDTMTVHHMVDALEALGQEPDDIDKQLCELFGDGKSQRRRGTVTFAQFFEWFSGVKL